MTLKIMRKLHVELGDDDLIRRGDAVKAIRDACVFAHLPFNTGTPEGQRTMEAIRAVREVPAAKEG